MSDWFVLALAALLLMGSQRCLYKVAVERSCDIAWTTLAFMGTVTLVSTGVFLFRGAPVPDGAYLLATGLVNSLAFLLATVTHMEALKRLPATARPSFSSRAGVSSSADRKTSNGAPWLIWA